MVMETVALSQHQWNHRDLVSGCARAVRQARELGKPVLISQVYPVPACDPLVLWSRSTAYRGQRMLFCKSPVSLVALGELHALRAEGPRRYEAITRTWSRLVEGAVTADPPPAVPAGPLLVGGFSFQTAEDRQNPAVQADPRWASFGEAFFQLPQLLYSKTEDGAWLTAHLFCQPHDDARRVAARLEGLLAQGQKLVADAASGSPWDGGEGYFSLEAGETADTAPVPPVQVENVQPVEWWYRAVNALAGDMRQGRYQKAVLARQVRVRQQESWCVETLLQRLRRRERHAYLFAFERGDAVFAGATPERLVRLEDGRVQVAGVAGSIARGADEAQDRRYGEILLADSKNRREHQAVVETVIQALAPLCRELEVPAGPGLLKTPSVQHLYTPIEGRLREPMTVLQLAQRLHPTPAVCGLPRDAALAAIQRWEPFDRGWYAGPVGWMDARGHGELAVAIRSGLVRGREVLLYSGCGIMPDSDPEAEYEESCLKLGVMLSALGLVAEEMAGWRCQPS